MKNKIKKAFIHLFIFKPTYSKSELMERTNKTTHKSAAPKQQNYGYSDVHNEFLDIGSIDMMKSNA